MDKKLESFLKKNSVKYETEEHRKVYTAFDEAETQKLKTGEVAKTVLVKTEKDLALAVIPSGKNLDFNKVKKALGAKKVSLAREADITKKLGTKIGLLHPFGPVYKISTLIDSSLLRNKKLIASAGSYTESVILKPKDFEKLVQPLKGSFAKAK